MAQAQRIPAAQMRDEAVRLIRSIEGHNTYSQAASKRERVFETPGYGDCSSTARKVLERAGLGYSIGSNTSSQVGNRTRLGIVVDSSSTGYPDQSKLLPGDLLYFKGNSGHVLDVGHVEMYIGDGYCMGHGSGKGPTRKVVKDYCKSRISKTRRYFMAIRFLFDFGERPLAKGCSGADVRMLQQALLDLGCTLLGDSGANRDGVDSDFGARTDKAVRWYQAKTGLKATGVMDAALAARLMSNVYPNTTPAENGDDDDVDRDYALGDRDLVQGMVGADVAELQEDLVRLGYALGDTGDADNGVDGEYGPLTAAAVSAFQSKVRLPTTGEFDDTTHTALIAALAALPALPAAVPVPDPVIIPDISVYQGDIDYDAFCAGCAFGLARARVDGKTDAKIVQHMREFKARSFPFSVYDYVMLTSAADAVNQANAMLDLCAPYDPEVYYLDIEKLADGVDYDEIVKFARVYIARLRALGVRKIGVYTGDSRWHVHLYPLADVIDDVWIASWGSNNGYLSKLPTKIVGGIQQYTSMAGAKVNGKKVLGAPGVGCRVDLNRLTGKKPISWYTGRSYDGTGYSGVAKVAGDSVNIRVAASASSTRLDTVSKGVLLPRRTGDTEGWLAVRYKDYEAFISAKYCSLING